MRLIRLLAMAAVVFATPVHAEAPLEKGFAGALLGCEEWVLNPASWANGVAPFVTTVGLGEKMEQVAQIDEILLPPPSLRAANRYWRINSTPEASFVLVVSEDLPMCHITGGGAVDLQPAAESVLGAQAFADRWEAIGSETSGEALTTAFRHRKQPALLLLVTHATTAGQPLDRVQVIATASYIPD